MRVRVHFRKVYPDARVPTYAHGGEEDAGLDLAYYGSDIQKLGPGEPASAFSLAIT
jgi:hypothetical protein